jgi:UDPglucose 6-dehydrogenase
MSSSQPKVAVIGTGYVGLVTGVCFASQGINVICMDNIQAKVDKLKSGICTIYEPGLSEVMVESIAKKNLEFTTDLEYAVNNSDVIFMCLPTPPKEDGSADLSYVSAVAKSICSVVKSNKIIVNKSTVPVGTCDAIKQIFKDNIQDSSLEMEVISNPEFLREGFAVKDFLNPDRIIIGIDTESETKQKEIQATMSSLYQDFVQESSQIIFMDVKSSEMTKYAGNSFLAIKISFINEMANLCEKVGANIDAVRRGIGSDIRIGDKFLVPGIGYGGSCFPKDVKALNSTSEQMEYKFEILDAVMRVNKKQKRMFIEKISHKFNRVDFSGLTFGVWGLSFKANTDDIRESPAIEIIQALLKKGAKIKCYDPKGAENFKHFHPEMAELVVADKYDAVTGADALIILTEWQEFKACDLEKVKKTLNPDSKPLIFDGRNLFDPNKMNTLDFDYISVGR